MLYYIGSQITEKCLDIFGKFSNQMVNYQFNAVDIENLTKTLPVFNKVWKSLEFCNYFCNRKEQSIWNEPWYFAKAEDTEKILKEIGFKNIEVFLENKVSKFHDKEDYFIFIKTIVLRPYLEYLSNDKLKNMFAKAVVHEIETNFKELQWKLDYVKFWIY